VSAKMARTTTIDKVRELQRTLYRAAKADPGRRFHALYDKVYRRDVMERAWGQVRRNRGAAGIDQITLADVEQYGVSRMLDELAGDLREGRYRPLPGRRAWIPKPGTEERRPLSIPAVRDRVVQAASKIVIEPIFEADFLPCSFGFRPKKSAQDALQVLIDEAWRGNRWVLETDIASCFEAIPHDRLMTVVEERVCDRHILKLLRALLRAGVMEEGMVRHRETGTPQGGVISPLLANVYLNQLDRAWQRRGCGVLCRYADDLVVMCWSRQEAEQALATLRTTSAELGLALKKAKTRIVHLREGGEGIDFLGFHHRWVRNRGKHGRHLTFLARWPSRKAMQAARDRIRELTARKRLLLTVEEVVEDANLFLFGWAGYFRYGNSARHFHKIRQYALSRLGIFVANRHKKSKSHGWHFAAYLSPNNLGLTNLNGSVVAPRPNRPWRGKPNATGKGRR
jgi:group II intron reverse transcriptase/maturase